MRIESGVRGALGVLSVTAALTWAPMASADPAEPAPPPGPAAADSAVPAVPSAPSAAAVAADAVPHLVSPQNLPPGASIDPIVPEGRNLGYLRDLWHAVQTQEVSGGDALLLLTQRPMDANATPPPGMPTTPQGPVPEPGPQ